MLGARRLQAWRPRLPVATRDRRSRVERRLLVEDNERDVGVSGCTPRCQKLSRRPVATPPPRRRVDEAKDNSTSSRIKARVSSRVGQGAVNKDLQRDEHARAAADPVDPARRLVSFFFSRSEIGPRRRGDRLARFVTRDVEERDPSEVRRGRPARRRASSRERVGRRRVGAERCRRARDTHLTTPLAAAAHVSSIGVLAHPIAWPV